MISYFKFIKIDDDIFHVEHHLYLSSYVCIYIFNNEKDANFFIKSKEELFRNYISFIEYIGRDINPVKVKHCRQGYEYEF